MIQYSSIEGDLVCDLFLGGFSTAIVSFGMKRNVIGFEISNNIFEHGMKKISMIKPGQFLNNLRKPNGSNPVNQGKPWTSEEISCLSKRYEEIYLEVGSKSRAIYILCDEFGRGRFSIMNALENINKKNSTIEKSSTSRLDDFLRI